MTTDQKATYRNCEHYNDPDFDCPATKPDACDHWSLKKGTCKDCKSGHKVTLQYGTFYKCGRELKHPDKTCSHHYYKKETKHEQR